MSTYNMTTGLTSGIGLKPAHYEQALTRSESGLWFEVHTENYFVSGGDRLRSLRQIRECFPLSLHGVGASLGGPALPSKEHLSKVRALVDQLQPQLVSEHAVWSSANNRYFAELLPLPRTHEALQRLVDGISCYQEAIGRPILIENPTNYLSFKSEMDEADFLVEVCKRSGCGLLLDVNNLFLSSHNCGLDVDKYLDTIPASLVGEIHVAGYDEDENYGAALLIDSHASPVSKSVWQLLNKTLKKLGPKPVLLERDSDLPSFEELIHERQIAASVIDQNQADTHAI